MRTSLVGAHHALGAVKLVHRCDHPGAKRDNDRALEQRLAQTLPVLWYWIAGWRFSQGRGLEDIGRCRVTG